MSITIRAGGTRGVRIVHPTTVKDDENTTSEINNAGSPSERQVTAAERAARRAKRAQRLATQKSEDTEGIVGINLKTSSNGVVTTSEVNTTPSESNNNNSNGQVKFGGANKVTIKSSSQILKEQEEKKAETEAKVEVTPKPSNDINTKVESNVVAAKVDLEPPSVRNNRDKSPGRQVFGLNNRDKSPGRQSNVVAAKVDLEPPSVRNNRDKSPGRQVFGVRGRINNFSQQPNSQPDSQPKPAPQRTYGGSSPFQFGQDFTKKGPPPPSSVGNSAGRFGSAGNGRAVNKYTPTLNNRAPREPERFQGIKKEDPPIPSFGGSAADRMAQFRAAAEKEKVQKAKEEKKKEMNEKMRKDIEEKKKAEAEKKKDEEANKDKKREEEMKALEAKAAEEEKTAIPDSERMRRDAPCKKKKEKKPARRTMSISNIVLDWVQEMTKDYPVEIRNFSSSWNNGMAFCALMHKFNPDAFDFSELTPENKRHNFDLAFETGLKCKDIPILLDTEDMVRMEKPEPRSVQCYIQWIWSVYGPTSGYGPTPQEVQSATIS